MTDEERIDREALLRRAAAVVGAVYLAPVLTSAAAGASEGCPYFTCSKKKRKWLSKHRKKCQASGAGCDCPAPGTRCLSDCSCIRCFQGQGCPMSDQEACRPLQPCGQSGTCACLLCIPNRDSNGCMAFRSNFCADYPPCSKQDGSGCPPGHFCYDSCCPEGLCELTCSNASAPRISRSAGSGPTLTT